MALCAAKGQTVRSNNPNVVQAGDISEAGSKDLEVRILTVSGRRDPGFTVLDCVPPGSTSPWGSVQVEVVANEIALLLYGKGAELGDFKLFADDLATDLVNARKFAKTNIVIKETTSLTSVLAALNAVGTGQLKELHIFSHSIGGGLYVGYHDAAAGAQRANALRGFPSPHSGGSAPKISYDEVVKTEAVAGILTDHLLREPLKSAQATLKRKFAAGAFIKLWGCNAGRSHWIYSDDTVTDQNAPAQFYYWRALNTQNTPKPSITRAFADFCGVDVYGAGSASHIEVRHNGKWIDSGEYKKVTGRFAGEPETLRLHPDQGEYNKVSPAPP